MDTGNIPAFQICERVVLPSADSKRFWSNEIPNGDQQWWQQALRQKLRSLGSEWRGRSSEPAAATADLRSEFHAVHKRIKQISRQQGRLTKARLQHKESTSFRSDPFKYGRRIFRPQTTTKPDFDANEAMKYFRSVLCTQTLGENFSTNLMNISANHNRRISLHQLVRLRLLNLAQLYDLDETLPRPVRTALRTPFGNDARTSKCGSFQSYREPGNRRKSHPLGSEL